MLAIRPSTHRTVPPSVPGLPRNLLIGPVVAVLLALRWLWRRLG